MKLCINCLCQMEEKATECPHCGYVEGVNPMDYCHLPPRTELNDRYILGRPLGSGGFGVTYIAWDTVLEIPVAIKEFIPGELAKRTAGTRDVLVNQSANDLFARGKRGFMDESMRLARLGDIPGVVKIFDCFEANGTAYIVMEYLRGRTLQDWLDQNGKMSIDMCVNIMVRVLGALEKIHAAGLMHRDIAPDNIMLCRDGRVMLIDFGAARHMTTRHSRSLSTILKIGYAPVEQYYRDGDQGPWTDVYAVGATMYHALTGKIPPDAFTRANNDTLVRPSAYVSLPKNIEIAVLNAMNVSAARRTRTAAEFAAQLTGEVRAVRVTERIRQEKVTVSGRTKAALIASVAAVIAVLVLIIVGVPALVVPDTEAKVPEGMSRVPAIQNRLMEDAELMLSDSDLRLRVAELVYDDFFDRDMVLYQNPGAGSVAYIGSMVDVTVSAPEETVPVPDVTGFDAAAAQQTLTEAGFEVTISEEHDDIVAPGAVISQSITPDEEVKPGTVVGLVVSIGPEDDTVDTSVKVSVPDVTGLTYEQAQSVLQEQGLYVVIGSGVYSNTVPAGQIISQSPEENADANQGDVVTVVVSRGEETAVVPDVRFNTQQTAIDKITASNLKYEINREESETVSAGLVISQNIAAGTVLRPGDTVVITVSTGYSVSVPGCVGLARQEAESRITAARLSCAFTTQNSDTVPEGHIISQSVPEGQTVEQGTVITLVVSSGTRTVAVKSVSLSQSRLTMNVNDVATLAAAVNPSNASTAVVTWSSSAPSVAHVDAGGTVTALKAGTATITATTVDGGFAASCEVTVSRALSSVTVLSKPEKTVYYLNEGSLDKTGLSVRASYNDGTTADVTSKCTLSGFDASAAGTRNITVSFTESGVTRTASFSVSVAVPSVTLSHATASMIINETLTLTAKVLPEGILPSGTAVKWSSSDGSVAAVSDGKITAKKVGKATVTASVTCGGATYSASCAVTVEDAASDPSDFYYRTLNGKIIITKYIGSDDKVIVPSVIDGCPVTILDNGAFSGCAVSSVSLPDSLTKIGSFVFEECYSLTSVTIPKNVTVIDGNPFYNSGVANISVAAGNTAYKAENNMLLTADGTKLVAVSNTVSDTFEVPNGITTIGKSAFRESDITGVILPSTLVSIEADAFYYCNRLKQIDIPENVKDIGSRAFAICTSLNSVNIRNGVGTIGSFAFDGCRNLTQITIPASVTEVAANFVTTCTSLTSINVDSGNGCYMSDGGVLFTGDGTELVAYPPDKADQVYTIPDGVRQCSLKKNGNWATFELCDNLIRLNVPGTVEYLHSGFCTSNQRITHVRVGHGTKAIYLKAFSDCKKLTAIAVPDSVTDIDDGMIYDCPALTTIYCNEGSEAYDFAKAHGYDTRPYDDFPQE